MSINAVRAYIKICRAMLESIDRILFLTPELPYPASSGGKIREVHLIRILSERFPVEVICFNPADNARSKQFRPPKAEDIPKGVNISLIPRDESPFWKRSLAALRPPAFADFRPEVAEILRQRASRNTLLWVSRFAMAPYIPLAKSLGYRVILDEHNVESNLIFASALSSVRRLPTLWQAAQTSYYEARFCLQADLVVAASDIDASRLSKLAPGVPVHVIPNSIDVSTYRDIRTGTGRSLFFSGSLHQEGNLEALRWFASEVMPRLKLALGSQLPSIVVAGSHPSSDTRDFLQRAGIEVRSNPDSMIPFLADAAVVFAPIRSGSGTRLKILEAMAAGRAVVSTGKGAEGLVLSPTYDIWIADGADRFASAILHLLQDEQCRTEMGQRAAETIEQRYDWRQVRSHVYSVLDHLGEARRIEVK